MESYRIDLKYIGEPYEGWQSQPLGTGVQDHVEKALATMLRHSVRIIAASRTDSGVHAEHQVGIFRTAVAFDETKWLKSLHGLLPATIGITSIQPVAYEFHPVYMAKAKAYRYRLWLGAARNPLLAPYCWRLYHELDHAAMLAEAQSFVGRHDFTSFCAADSSARTKVRTVLEVEIARQGPLIDVWVLGQGFLKQMIRIMVGTLVDVGTGRRPPGSVAEILAARDRKAASRTAPAQGLSLVEIFYGDVPSIAVLRAGLANGYCLKIS